MSNTLRHRIEEFTNVRFDPATNAINATKAEVGSIPFIAP